SSASVRLQSTASAGNKPVLQKKKFNASAEEGLYRFLWRVHDGLPFHVKAGVEDHFSARGLADRSKKTMKIRIVFFGNGLQARRTVHMRDRRQGCPVLGAHVHHRDHVRHLRSR